MTEQIKSAIGFLTRYKGCQYEINPNECCHRECSECEYDFDVRIAQKDINTAIRSLQAWEEVLQELKYLKDRTASPTMLLAYSECIDIINQHLEEVSK